MIGVNPLRTKVLITTDEVVFHAPVDHGMDPRALIQSIIVAERRFVKPMLGSAIYDLLIDNKNLLVTSSNKAGLQTVVNDGRGTDREVITLKVGDYVNSDTYLNESQQALWYNYLHKIVAECVWFSSLPVNRSRFTSTGVMQNSPNSINNDGKSATVDLRDLKHLMDKGLQDRISPLIDDLHEYMCLVSYPAYTRSCGDCNDDGAVNNKKSGIILGMYDDDDEECCRKPRSSTSTVVTTVTQNEVIPFENVDSLIIPWNTSRKDRFGEGAVFQIEVIGEDGLYHSSDVAVEPDSIDNTTYYTINFSVDSTGRVIIS